MNASPQQAAADRLAQIEQHIGRTLMGLQQLEEALAVYYVMVAHAQRGMGNEAGQALIDGQLRKPLGATVRSMIEENRLTPHLAERFQKLLDERNWLVHHSRKSTRPAVRHAEAADAVLKRLQRLDGESGALLTEVANLSLQFARANGLTQADIDKEQKETLARWHTPPKP
jgi:hypothetical protein